MWNSLLVSIYTTPEYRPQEFAGEEFYFATIEEFEIAIDNCCNTNYF
jgi:guanylate kinase